MRIPWPHRPEQPISRLREAMLMSRVSENLLDVPDKFANLFELFASPHIHPRFREDIHRVLSGAVDLGLAMANPSYPATLASEAIANQMTILARLLGSLSERPTSDGFAVMLPSSRQLVGAFTTREEANRHSKLLCELGGKTCEVVPVQITSTIAVQPKALASPEVVAAPKEFPSVLAPAHATNPDAEPDESDEPLTSSSTNLPDQGTVGPPDGTIGNRKD